MPDTPSPRPQRWCPKGVVYLISALQFHELTLQMPSEVWMAIDRTASCPSGDTCSMMLRPAPDQSCDGGSTVDGWCWRSTGIDESQVPATVAQLPLEVVSRV